MTGAIGLTVFFALEYDIRRSKGEILLFGLPSAVLGGLSSFLGETVGGSAIVLMFRLLTEAMDAFRGGTILISPNEPALALDGVQVPVGRP